MRDTSTSRRCPITHDETQSVEKLDAGGRVVGFFHAGISVADLDRSLGFYRDELRLEVLMQRDATDDYLRRIHQLPFTVVRIAFVGIPNSATVLELIEYRGVDRTKPTYIPMDPATGHTCFLVDDIQALYNRLRARGYRARSQGPVEITAGPNKGSKAVYFEDPDGYPVEFIERARASDAADLATSGPWARRRAKPDTDPGEGAKSCRDARRRRLEPASDHGLAIALDFMPEPGSADHRDDATGSSSI
jgi:catechol 2,3-dioxygenase-like lactoylglutathione lyase family enzyme